MFLCNLDLAHCITIASKRIVIPLGENLSCFRLDFSIPALTSLLTTDPDCDRYGIAVKNGDDYSLLSGNEVGLLLLDYVCAQRTKHGKLPADPVFIKTIVTMDLAERIAARYAVRTIDILTGFKFIGEQIGYLEEAGKEESYICGFEESYGYMTGSYVRDKDGVNATFMICKMFAFYKTRGISLLEKLDELWMTYGYCLNTLHSIEFPGSSEMAKMKEIMPEFRKGLERIAGKKVLEVQDYSKGLNGLPKSDVLKYLLEGHYSVVVRLSGTEPKLKVYISVLAPDETAARQIEERMAKKLSSRFLQIADITTSAEAERMSIALARAKRPAEV